MRDYNTYFSMTHGPWAWVKKVEKINNKNESSLIALVLDFFIDVYFLHGLSTDTLIDVKYIHFEYAALIVMVIFEFTAFCCLPVTAFVFYKMVYFINLRRDIHGLL